VLPLLLLLLGPTAEDVANLAEEKKEGKDVKVRTPPLRASSRSIASLI
jgi:hypothetical protein